MYKQTNIQSLIAHTSIFLVGQGPSLQSFTLSLTQPEELRLTFNEVVSFSCIPTLLSFQNSLSNPTESVTFQTGSCMYDLTSSTGTVLSVVADQAQWSRIQSLTNLATAINNTYISLGEGFVSDVNGILSTAIVLRVGQFTPNINPPSLLDCMFDQQSLVLSMRFSEGVLLSSFDATGVSISSINSMTGERQNSTLTGGGAFYSGLGNNIVGIVLLPADYASISSGTTVANDFIITLSANSVEDANGMFNTFQGNVILTAYIADVQNPSVEGFSLDLDVGNIVITFSEAVTTDINYSRFCLANEMVVSPSLVKYSLNGSSIVNLENETVALIQLASTTLSFVLSDSRLCTATSNCFLLWDNGTFEDLNGNPSIKPQRALSVINIIGDISPPSLTAFSVDLLTGTIRLTFSEIIVVDTLLVSSFILANNETLTHNISGTIQTSFIPSNGLSTEVTILLSSSSLNNAKSISPLYLTVQEGAVEDSSGNRLSSISSLAPSNTVADNVAPLLVSFVPGDPTSQQIVLVFNEFVDPNSWHGNRLFMTIQVSTGDFTYDMFTGGSVSASPSDNLTYNFSTSEFSSSFREQYSEAFIMGAIIIMAEPGLVQDVSGNIFASSATLTYSALPPDQTNPILDGFSLDMNTGTLQLSFNEPVFLRPELGFITFINENTSSPSTAQRHALLENGMYSSNQTRAMLIATLALSARDVNSLKANTGLCTSASDCYILVTSELAADRSGNDLQAELRMVTEYHVDATPPLIMGFVLDLTQLEIILTFSEPILNTPTSPNLSGFSLIGYSNSSSAISLSTSSIATISAVNATAVLDFPSPIFNQIVLDSSLCINSTNCYLRADAESFADTSGNPAEAAVVERGVVIPDTNRPVLLSFTIDLNNGLLTLLFNEPVNANSLNFTFNDTVISERNFSTLLEIAVDGVSLDSIKLQYSSNAASFGLNADSSLIVDVSGNSLMPVFLQPSDVVLDTTSPMLTQFTPGAPLFTSITFYFNEAVNASNFQENQFVLTLTIFEGTVSYSGFTGGSVIFRSVGKEVEYNFSPNDFNSTIRTQYLQAAVNGSMSLSITSSLITDLFGNSVVEISSSNPIQFTNDETRPELISFILDLNRGAVYLLFSEPVIVTVPIGVLRIQNSDVGETLSHTLSRNSTVFPSGEATESVTVLLSEADTTFLITSPELATSTSNTFIRIENFFASDLSGHGLLATTRVASELIQDSILPTVSSFQLDVDQGVLTVNYSELIYQSSLNLTGVFLTSNGQPRYSLIGGIPSGPNITQTTAIILSLETLNAIKLDPYVCIGEFNCSLLVLDGAFNDLSSNGAVLSRIDSPQAFFPDVTPPNVLSFSMDLNVGEIILTFSEPILVEALRTSHISLQVLAQVEQLDGVQVEDANSYNSVVTLSLNINNVNNRLKVLSSMGALTLFLTSDAATDTNQNPIQPISSLSPSSLVPDMTPPAVTDFVPSAGTPLSFILIFNEPIGSSSLNASQLSFTLKNQNGQFDYMNLAPSSFSLSADLLSLSFSSSEARFTDIGFQERYLLSYLTGYICFNLAPAFIFDVTGNPYSSPLTIIYTNTTDRQRPELVGFSLDLNRGYLNLTFTEDVTVLSVKGNARLQSRTFLPIVYNLNQEREIIYMGNASMSRFVSILLNDTDLTTLISNPSIGSSTTNTYLLIGDQLAIDASGNLLNASETPLQASQVTQFIVGTSIIEFDLDLDSDILTIDFDKPVNISTFNSNQISLTNVSDSSNSNQDRIQLGRVDLLSEPGSSVTSFRFLLRVDDSIRIKSSVVCSVTSNCFGSFMAGLILDSTGNSTRPSFLRVSNLITDVTPPRLVTYTDFDLNRGTFTLAFSEPVDGTSADFTDIELWDKATNPVISLTLMSGQTISNNIRVQFQLTLEDLNLIKSVNSLCTSATNCWIRLLSFFIYDFAGNPFLHSNLDPGAVSSLHQPLVFIPDTTPPTLVLFSVDINNGSLYLSFDEVIDDSTFNPQDITLLNMPGGSTSKQLSSSTIVPQAGPTQFIFFSFTRSDLNEIKSLPLLTSRADSYLSLTTSSLADTSGNVAQNIPSSQALQASAFNMDLSQPQVVSFEQYNNDEGSLILRFNEPIDIDSFSAPELTLFSEAILQSSHFTLTGGTPMYHTSDGLSVSLTLTSMNLRSIKMNTGLCTSRDNTYITISSSAVTDRQGNPVQPLLLPFQLGANGYIPDITPAFLSEYSLDLDTGFISLLFSDVMNFSTFNGVRFTLQDDRVQPSHTYSLGTSYNIPRISDTWTFQLSQNDYNSLLSNTGLASSASNTFVSFNESLLQDVSGLQVTPILTSAALPPLTYTADQTSPDVSSFDLDLNIGLLQLTFSEPVVVSSIALPSLQLQTARQAVVNSTFPLTDEKFVEEGENSLFLTINFTVDSLNVLKSIGFQSINDTFVSVQPSFGIDTSGNLFQQNIIQVTNYIRDFVPPILLYFDLNLRDSSALQLYFSEAISFADGAVESITLQSATFNPSVAEHLTSSNIVRTLPTLYAAEVSIVDPSLIFMLLNNPGIASSTMNLFLSMSAEGFRDFAGNGVIVIPSDSAQRVRYICKLEWPLK